MEGVGRPETASGHPFVGRADLWAEIDLLLSETAEGTGRGLLLTGPGGVGKSELLRATAGRAARREFRVATARALPDELPAPFALARDLLDSLARGPEPVEESEPAPAGLPVMFVPVFEESGPGVGNPVLGDLGRPAGDALERIRAPVGRTRVEGLGAGRERMYARLIEHFLSAARRQPLLLALDDLPFADRSSLEFLRRLVGELGSAPLAVVATSGEPSGLPPANRDLVEAIGASPTIRTIALRPLTVAELAEFVTFLQRGVAPSAADVERWHAQTDGNPLFVEQLVRSSLGEPRRDPGATDPGANLLAVLLARIRALDDGDRRILTYAAVLGREFDFPRLAAAAGVEEERLTEALDRLVLTGLVREKGAEVYEFVSEAARAAVYAELTETRRRILHRRVGAALETRGGASVYELARQFYLGREHAKTVEYNVRAAEAAAQSYAFEAAISHLTRALEGERLRPDRDPTREVRLLTELGRLLHETSDLLRSEETLSEAVDLARARPGDRQELGRALLALAWSRVDRGRYESAEELAAEAIRLLEEVGTPHDLLSAHRVLGNVYWRSGDLKRAESHQRLALDIAEREGTPYELGHALVDVANTLVPQGEVGVEPALAMYGRAAELFASAEDPSARARVLMNRAVLEYGAGRVEAAFRDLEIALEAAERSRSPLWIGYCLLNLAQWKAEADEASAGRSALDRADELLRPLDDRLANQQIAMTRGMISEAERAYDRAESEYRESLDLARELHLAAETSELFYRLGQLSLRRGDRAGARRWLDEAVASGIGDHRPDLAPKVSALARTATEASA